MSDDEHWEWDTKQSKFAALLDADGEEEEEDDDDDDNLYDNPAAAGAAAAASVAGATATATAVQVRAERAAYERFLRKHPSFKSMQHISGIKGIDVVFREMCRLQSWEYPLDCPTFKLVSKFYSLLKRDNPFSDLPEVVAPAAAAAASASAASASAPADLGKVMQVFVKTVAGKTITVHCFRTAACCSSNRPSSRRGAARQ
jgi:hypothetical protein